MKQSAAVKLSRRMLLGLALAALLPFGSAAVETGKPSLVVVLSIDQMRTDYLDRFRPWFVKDGFNRFLEGGAVFPENRFRHAITFTGPGHASIGTGLDPRDHGIIGNRWYDRIARSEVYCVEDRRVAWVGAPESPSKVPWMPASPVLLADSSLGDRLKERFPASRVVGIALKDRSAVLMAGRKADAALWFEDRFERFVTSSYYPPQPSLLAFNTKLQEFFASRKSWELSERIPAADLERITFDPPELSSAKNQPENVMPTFPHPLPTVRAAISSPYGDELLLEFARHVVADLDLGRNPSGAPDLLFVGLSSTDYYGHWFGPDSKEIADGIVRLDGTLEAFFGWLDARVGRDRALLFLTGDHGVMPLPEVTIERNRRKTGRTDASLAGRVNFGNGRGESPTVYDGSVDRFRLELHLSKKFGYKLRSDRPNAQEGAIAYFEEPAFYLNKPVLLRRKLSPERVKEAVRDWAKGRDGVLVAYTNTEIVNGLPPTAPFALPVERSFRSDRSGDVLVILKPGWMWSYGTDAGATHGQPHDDDTRVPLLVWGAGVRAGSWNARVSPLSIARTVGALFGFEAGASDAEVLQPVLGREMGTKKMAVTP